jgi:hypothetical protein
MTHRRLLHHARAPQNQYTRKSDIRDRHTADLDICHDALGSDDAEVPVHVSGEAPQGCAAAAPALWALL